MLLFERPGKNPDFDTFLISNQEELFKIFDQLEIESNYFSMREGLKTQYRLLSKNEALRKYYTHDKDRLRIIMNTVLSKNKVIQYEAFLLLSIFILSPIECDSVRYTLTMNRKGLNEFIKSF